MFAFTFVFVFVFVFASVFVFVSVFVCEFSLCWIDQRCVYPGKRWLLCGTFVFVFACMFVFVFVFVFVSAFAFAFACVFVIVFVFVSVFVILFDLRLCTWWFSLFYPARRCNSRQKGSPTSSGRFSRWFSRRRRTSKGKVDTVSSRIKVKAWQWCV